MLLKASSGGFGKTYPTDVFLLGSGFSKAISPLMPTLPELSKAVLKRCSGIFAGGLPPEAQENVEVAIAYLLNAHPWRRESENLRHAADGLDLIAAIAPVLDHAEFEALGEEGSNAPEWLIRLVHWMHDEQAAILTLNYDTLLERAFAGIRITSSGHPYLLNPRALYPIQFKRQNDEPAFGSAWPTAELLKLHGSLSWYYSGAKDFFGEVLEYRPTPPWSSSTRWSSPNDDKVPLIAPPVGDKSMHLAHESLRAMWSRARQHLSRAKRVFCIGFGFPDTDLPIRFLLADAGRRSIQEADFYLIDVNTQLKERVLRFLPAGFNLKDEFFGPDWPSRLIEHLYAFSPHESQTSHDAGLTRMVRARVEAAHVKGQFVSATEGIQNQFRLTEITDLGITLLDVTINVPITLTWIALGRIVDHLQRPNGLPLSIARTNESYNSPSVDYLLSRWYSRAVGSVATAILFNAGIVTMQDPFIIGGLNSEFSCARVSG